MAVGDQLKADAVETARRAEQEARRQRANDRRATQRLIKSKLASDSPRIVERLIEALREKAKSGGGEVEWRWATYNGWDAQVGDAVGRRVVELLHAENIEAPYRPYSSSGTVDGDGYSRGDSFQAGEVKAWVKP